MKHNLDFDPDNKRSDVILSLGKQVIDIEIAGLTALDECLNDNFVHIINIIFQTKGRMIISGMGKSGHIGRKIAATLASTGTPSYFVHPAEASHGDLGMITESDCVIALSNSGETQEILNLLNYCKRFSIPLIGITQKPHSTLHELANYALIIPNKKEACPMGLAPTTSTTMMLALGDAIAICLLHKRGFSSTDFHKFHPGGKLGAQLMRVEDLMHVGEAMPIVVAQTPLSEVLLCMTSKSFGCAGVVNADHQLIGIITDGDLRRHMTESLLTKTAIDIMTQSPKTISQRALASEALGIMNNLTITSLFVVEEKQPIGIIHIHDCLRIGL